MEKVKYSVSVPWSFLETIWACLFIVVVMLVFSALVDVLGINILQPPMPLFALIFQYLVIAVTLGFFTRWRRKADKKQLGLTSFAWCRAIISILKGFAIFFLFGLLASILAYLLGSSLPGYQEQISHVSLFGFGRGGIAAFLVLAAGVAPVVEEVFFRGFVLAGFENRLGHSWGNILSALLFAIFHLELSSIIPLFILGLILNWLYRKNKSVYPGIIFHAINNLIVIILEILAYV